MKAELHFEIDEEVYFKEACGFYKKGAKATVLEVDGEWVKIKPYLMTESYWELAEKMESVDTSKIPVILSSKEFYSLQQENEDLKKEVERLKSKLDEEDILP